MHIMTDSKWALGVMKQPSCKSETIEFNLSQALNTRCEQGDKFGPAVCGKCESCLLGDKVVEAKEWIQRFGSQSQRRFILGLIQRVNSVDILNNILTVVQPLLNKDYTYSRSRTQPSLKGDLQTMSGDRALSIPEVEKEMAQTFDWFWKCNYWTKSNFILSLLKFCDAALIFQVATLAKTLLVSEKATEIHDDGFAEDLSMPSSRYTYDSDEHPEHDLLRRATPAYSVLEVDPFTDELLDDFIVYDDAASVSSGFQSIEPACMVVPNSTKAYLGVAKYRDFVRTLPVNLSKYIFNFLDTKSQQNCACVSKAWSIMIPEVHKEMIVSRSLKEEVVLMQGAAAKTSNPVYANFSDIPVPNLVLGTWEVIETGEPIIETNFKNEVTVETAYSGVSTRNVIMEERNVFCGAYNTMVLCAGVDENRVMHTAGGLVATGSRDRKIHFIDGKTGKIVGPTPHGHAGSIKCIYINEKRGFVLSGSYDTSIRSWDMKTGTCLKMLRGHQDTITSITMFEDLVCSGSKDSTCKVWDLTKGICNWTFRHKDPVSAVAIGDSVCISGCVVGSVRVWCTKSGEMIKELDGHHQTITSIKFDRWHIVTGSKDMYALVWSAQGIHKRCLNALRHQKAVLCLGLLYLRCVSGCEDGRLRIWNIITGQCCRIMRGNSASDPILSLVTIENKIILNTHANLLALNFEDVEWDFTLNDDTMPPLVQYGSYKDAPIRKQPYSYTRAQRMKLAGATNTQITGKTQEEFIPRPESPIRLTQTPHSRLLSAKSTDRGSYQRSAARSATKRATSSPDTQRPPTSMTVSSKHATIVEQIRPESRATIKSATSNRPSTGNRAAFVTPADDSDEEQEVTARRRISWAFQKPPYPKSKELSISEAKSALRMQIRTKENLTPPDYIYLAVNAIHQADDKTNLTKKNTDNNVQEVTVEETGSRRRNRPSSSPSRIDPRTKVVLTQDELDDLFFEEDIIEVPKTPNTPQKRQRPKSFSSRPVSAVPRMERYKTDFTVTQFVPPEHKSLHSTVVPTSIPRGRVLKARPHSTTTCGRMLRKENSGSRPHSAAVMQRPVTAISSISSVSFKKAEFGPTTASSEINIVPMLMYPPNMKEQMQERLKSRSNANSGLVRSASETNLGKVSAFNDPMRNHLKFKLKTHQEEEKYMQDISDLYARQKRDREVQEERERRKSWLAKAKGT